MATPIILPSITMLPQRDDDLPAGPPPPYIENELDHGDYYDDDEENRAPNINLSINASQLVKGNHNLVPLNGIHLAHAAKVGAMLVSAISQADRHISHNEALYSRRLNVNLNLHCGINVIGDRNIIGTFGIAQKTGSAPNIKEDTTAGAKRKADDDSRGESAKRVAKNGDI